MKETQSIVIGNFSFGVIMTNASLAWTMGLQAQRMLVVRVSPLGQKRA
jgi:hypothetical protein